MTPPLVKDDQVSNSPVYVGTDVWYEHWLSNPELISFRYECPDGSFTARRRKGDYWNAYRKVNGKLRQEYLGKTTDLTQTNLIETAKTLALDNTAYWRMKYPKPQQLDKDTCITVGELEVKQSDGVLYNQSEICITELQNEVVMLKAELAKLKKQLAAEQVKVAEALAFQSQYQSPDLDKVRDRFLMTQSPGKRRELKRAIDQFIRDMTREN